MKTEYAQRPGEQWHDWFSRIYQMAKKESEEKGGWMHVDPELLTIILNNLDKLLPD